MSFNQTLRVDDLSTEETAAVAHAYLDALSDGTASDPFDLALEVLCGFRPALPVNIAAAELELLLVTLPALIAAPAPQLAAQLVAAQG